VVAAEDVVEVAEEVEAVALAVEAVADHLELKARTAAPIQITIHLLSGTNYHLKSETKFVKSMTRKVSKAGPSIQLVIFPSNSLQRLSSARSKMTRLQPLLSHLPTLIPPETMQEMLLAEKRERSAPSSLD
jgi:hypothetical protein